MRGNVMRNSVKLIPAHIAADDSEVPAQFQFLLNEKDWQLLICLASVLGGVIGQFYDHLDVYSCDEYGHDVEATAQPEYFRCLIFVHDFRELDIRPGHFNDYLGETALIPLVYDMLHFPEQP